MASRLLQGARALEVQSLRACGPAQAVAPSIVSRGGIPSDEEQATDGGKERFGCLQYVSSKGSSGDYQGAKPDKQIVGCIFEEENSAVIWFWIDKGKTQS
ncbi:cytochrome c oxidase subunit 5B, mitochondrial-like [Dromiciops gliroides]|uniref:cytochrome c oxidase subunit 5B, mitochondrial-like n=1 Tax=Dromiciops gliroides TaxID=33562 RepID=UPI001CC4E3C5|nr:cytochrome c oxidase subunit 5B, mitochondrial-like [Dromiciops gliroides]